MRRFSEWFISRKENLTLVTALLLSVALLISNENPPLRVLRVWSLEGFGLILERVSFLTQWKALRQENQLLRVKSAELLVENSALREAAAENLRLRQLLGLKYAVTWDLVAAKVIGREARGAVNSIILAVGKRDSVDKNMVVVTADGLVGKLISVAQNYSTCQLMTDRNFRISAMVQRSRATGIVRWWSGSQLQMVDVVKRADVKAGDLVVTSGVSPIFPGGLPLGHVSEVDRESQDMFTRVLVAPAVDFSLLEEVFVIRKRSTLTDLN
ncbi:MAG: rod shape-determining protein MreC [Calditrichaeota bacterium]|nr:MAG: rod shape-determining protein MreC [Calditrichota bacterium]